MKKSGQATGLTAIPQCLSQQEITTELWVRSVHQAVEVEITNLSDIVKLKHGKQHNISAQANEWRRR